MQGEESTPITLTRLHSFSKLYIFLFSSHLNSGEFGNSDSLGSVHSAFVRVDVF